MHKDSGFTIFELMTVLAIIAILCSIALPAFMSWLPNYRMRSGADELLSVLWLTQKRAVRENADVTIDFDFANDSFRACLVSSDNGTCDPGEQIVSSVQMPPGIDLADVSPRRYFCHQCHVTQSDAVPLIENDFRAVDSLSR
jgi:prepilin-type N-terminal cleavage/methylation domain-containing protein